ncbi:heavy metal translocating P-type ATPase, partial [Salmonella enterica subsp. enterica serovar Enteritidis]|nr:heavy metal translocating P-type ATPase [Salmonella enterica subsp. enterica serovar Enteritidis]
MNCCATAADVAAHLGGPSADEIRLSARDLGSGLRQTDLSIPAVHCGACISAIEGAFASVDGVETARLNLTTRRLAVKWRGEQPPPIIETLNRIGYQASLFDDDESARDPELARLIRVMAFAGFGAMNIMLLSVSVWSGADAETRQAFHWISAALALPVLLYSGRIFYQSAWSALRHGRTNMDVPISIGITLAYGLSLYDTIHHGDHAYFDASTSLVFFLLIGRVFDHMMRTRARTAILGLGRLLPRGAMVLRDNGERDYLPAEEIAPGMRLAVNAGDRLIVDAVVEQGSSDIDSSIVTGESAARPVAAGDMIRSGSLNLSGPLTVVAASDSRNSLLAEMIELMQAAEGGRSRYRRIADRASRLYSPVVHLTALLTMIGWIAATGDWHRAISIAIAVLIITCPCALGLAVPMVQVVAARRLFEAGIMVKDGSGMERMTEIDAVVFDKTGTLT